MAAPFGRRRWCQCRLVDVRCISGARDRLGHNVDLVLDRAAAAISRATPPSRRESDGSGRFGANRVHRQDDAGPDRRDRPAAGAAGAAAPPSDICEGRPATLHALAVGEADDEPDEVREVGDVPPAAGPHRIERPEDAQQEVEAGDRPDRDGNQEVQVDAEVRFQDRQERHDRQRRATGSEDTSRRSLHRLEGDLSEACQRAGHEEEARRSSSTRRRPTSRPKK